MAVYRIASKPILCPRETSIDSSRQVLRAHRARGIVNRSKRDIVESLAMHPLVNSYSLAKDIAAQYFELNRDYIDGWTD